MAVDQSDVPEETFCNGQFEDNLQEQKDEVLALQSIYNTDDEEKLKVLSEVSESGEGLFRLMVTVAPQPVSEEIQVEVAMPAEPAQMEAAAAPVPSGPPLQLPKNIELNRTISGRQWHAALSLKYLSPMCLYATFPASYPSEKAPSIHLSCPWMSPEHMEAVVQMLTEIWNEGFQMPILFTWIDWLENSMLSHLRIIDHLLLQPSVLATETDATSGGAWEEELGETIALMIRYNSNQMDIEFCQTSHECHVCYDQKPGTQFFRMHDCPHHFCHDCMFAFCDMHVTQGTVEELRCPDTDCDGLIPPNIVQAVLGPEQFVRWEQLLLQKTLDGMTDTVYCPRCGSLVIKEEEEDLNLAHCTVCFFAFCTLCQKPWHQGRECETDEDVLEQVQRRDPNKLSVEERRRYNELVRRLQEQVATNKQLSGSTRRCPSCKALIEKTGGCNKMTCKCGTFFCWLCGKKINGYSHFTNSSCALFEYTGQPRVVAVERRMPPDAVLRMQVRMEMNPDLLNNRTYCPTCKQMNLKGEDRNNHIKCWNCKTNFCFLCGQKIIGSINAHFIGPCTQHS